RVRHPRRSHVRQQSSDDSTSLVVAPRGQVRVREVDERERDPDVVADLLHGRKRALEDVSRALVVLEDSPHATRRLQGRADAPEVTELLEERERLPEAFLRVVGALERRRNEPQPEPRCSDASLVAGLDEQLLAFGETGKPGLQLSLEESERAADRQQPP